MFKNKKIFSVAIVAVISLIVLTGCSLPSWFPWFRQPTRDFREAQTIQYVPQENRVVSNQNTDVVSNVRIQGYELLWNEVQGVGQYYVAVFANHIDPTYFAVNTNSYNFYTHLQGSNILGFRVGVRNNSNELEMSNIVYHNPVTEIGFSDRIFFFDGRLGDFFIESQAEFNHVAHFAFITRLERFPVRLSVDFANQLRAPGRSFFQAASHMLDEAFQHGFMETMSISYSAQIHEATRVVTVNLNIFGSQPLHTANRIAEQNKLAVPFHKTVNMTPRPADFNNFVTDHRIITVPVTTSEELFWAVEGGATPIFTSTSSPAYRMYSIAKDILREIISDDMTEFEKLLSIFDFICFTTVYDWVVVNTNNLPHHFTAYRSFYLEGVLEDGLAVCDGFSKAFSLLANMEGISTVRIVGDAGGGHAWNKTRLDGVWYAVDITWTEIQIANSGMRTEFLAHEFFLVSDATIHTHRAHISNQHKNFAANYDFNFFGTQFFYYNNYNHSAIINTRAGAEALLGYLWTNFHNDGIVSRQVVMTGAIAGTNAWRNIVDSTRAHYANNPYVASNHHVWLVTNNRTIIIDGVRYTIFIVQVLESTV